MDCSHQRGARLARFIRLAVGMLAVIAPVQGATRVFMVPDDVTIAPGATVVIQLWLEDTVSAGLGPLRSYQMATDCEALPIGETTGSISHNPSPGAPPIACADGGSPCVDRDNPDWVFAPVVGVSAENAGPCPDLPPRAGGAAVAIDDSQDVTDARYLTEAAYTASENASGDFSVTIQNPDLGDQGHSFLRAMNADNILFSFDDPGAVIHVVVDLCAGVDCSHLDDDCNDGVCDSGTGNCLTVAKADGTGCTDDMNECTVDECVAGSCAHSGVEAGTACGDQANSDCDDPNTCDANGACQDNNEPAGAAPAGACGDTNDCTADECDGQGDCTNPNLPPDTPCGDPANSDCDDPDTCDGAGACQNNNDPAGPAPGQGCGDTNDCTADECDGLGACTNPDLPPDTPCGDNTDTDCDNPDICDGAGNCDNNGEQDGTLCDDGDDCTEDDECLDRVCEGLTVLTCLFGDITTTAAGDCEPQCTGAGADVSFDDVLCALEGFSLAANCPCADIKGPPGPNACIPNGVIDFDDILTILNAFSGIFDCPFPCPGPDPAPIMDPPERDRRR